MNPAFSVILLTTLTGAGQGLFIALYAVEIVDEFDLIAPVLPRFFTLGSALAATLLIAGLAASFFHLGHPERAWRSAAMWRTSWLSREVIVLPALIVAVALYGIAHDRGSQASVWIGAGALVLSIALFVCTGMIYACIKFLQEWHTPLTLINFFLLGTASGLMLAAALAAHTVPGLVTALSVAAVATTVFALIMRVASLCRNARIRLKSSLQTAIGVKHPQIAQKAQGAMGGSFNTREFFHGKSLHFVRSIKWIFLLLAFPIPIALALLAIWLGATQLVSLAFLVQFAGLIAERWFFFAQARHPQNLYYQAIS